jgi:ABC-type lipoprotein export system ATPase subunit
MDFAGMTLNGILSDSISGFHYLPLPDTSVAIVGPNGVGKSSLIKALQRCIQGDAGNRTERSMVHLDLLLPRNLENWMSENKDPGIIKSIRDLLISRDAFTWLKENHEVETKDYLDLLTTLWTSSVGDIKSEWLLRMRYSKQEPTSDTYLDQIVEKHTRWFSYISVPLNQVPADHEQFSQQYLAESKANEQGRDDAYDPALAGFNFDITPVGNSRTPQWRIDLIFKVPVDELTIANPLTEIAQMLVWPKSLPEAMEYRGQFGFGEYGADGMQEMKQYVRFINGEAWFGLNVGVTQNPLGFNFINPDEISWSEVREAAIELIDDGVTFSEGGWSNLAFRLNNQEGQTKQTRLDGEEKGVLPIDSTLSFTKEFDAYLKKYSDMASDFFSTFIPGAPRLEFTSNRKEYWITKGLVQIEVRDGYIQYELEELSEAQQRWAKISLLLTAYQYSNLALFIDEPERGIQRKIESTLLDLFEKVDVGTTSLPRFFATHSAEIISNCSTVIQVSRDTRGIRKLRRVVGSVLPYLQQLDISQEEFFQTKKLIVLTEGIMDKAMLDGFAFNRFQKEGIEVIHGFGLQSWSSYFDSQYLRKSSGVKVVFWADSLDMKKLNELIQRVKDENIEDKALVVFFTEHIHQVVKETWSKVQYEIVAAIIAESIRTNDAKVRIESTGDYDCIMWVTPQILGLPTTATWAGLISELNAQPRIKIMESRGKRFKSLVKSKLKTAGHLDGLNINRLKTICQELEISGQIPSEVNNLIERIIQFARD